MAKKHIITIAGRPGSGKSTTSHMVAKTLGYKHFSSGDLFREISLERGMDLATSNLNAEKGKSDIDSIVDQRLCDIGQAENNIVIDSRIAWHWIPSSFKVYLNLDMRVAADRILKDMTPERLKDENVPDNPEEYAAELKKRFDSETHRYTSFYGVDPSDLDHYNLVVDTAVNNPEQVTSLIVDAYNKWLQAA
ncbi:MAG: nucleoside monophosphate kinase [Candidatus Nomurabacteria bacterium]|jgi:cytidylate kinase|nr:nucleoside monophosphate kinase [Candidatus Nomurabacteria bacterium]